MERVGESSRRPASTVGLAIKVAVAVGAARRFVVGDPEIQLIDVLAGACRRLAAAEQHAEKGEVVVEQRRSRRSATASSSASARRTTRAADASPSLDGAAAARRRGARAAEPDDPLAGGARPAWLLPAVYERLRTGRASS